MIVGIFFALGAALSASIGYIFVKRGLEEVDYKIFILLSGLMGMLFSGLLIWLLGTGLSGLSFRAIYPFIITGILGGGLLARVSSTMATNEIGASKTHAIASASPLVTAFFGVAFLGEKVTLMLALGILAVVIGAAALSYLSYQQNTNESPIAQKRTSLGLILAFYMVIMIGLQPFLQKLGLNQGAMPPQGVFIRFGTATLIYVVYLSIRRSKLKFNIGKDVDNFIYASIAWALGPLLMLYALKSIPATVFSTLFRTGPLFTVILAHLFLKGIERVNWQIGLSSLFIVIGAILVSTV